MDARPSYLGYAFANVYNLSLLAGAAAASALTGDWAPAVVAGALEALWLFVGADSAPFRRWVDRRHAEKLRAEARAARRERIIRLPGTADRERAIDLVALHIEMGREIEKNEHWSGELVSQEYGRLDALLDSFVELAEAASRFERYSGGFNAGKLRGELAEQQRRSAASKDPEAAALAARNAELLQKRVETLEEMTRVADRARGQMSVIENTFRLLHDQVVSLKPPDDIKGQIDEISAGVEAVRSVLQESDQRLEREEPVAAGEERALAAVAVAPPVAEERSPEPDARAARGRRRTR